MTHTDPLDQFHRLIKGGNLTGLREYISSGASPNMRNQFAWTPLMLAALEGQTPVVRLLLSEGAEISAINDFGASALAYAALKGHGQTVRALLESGAPINVRPHGASLLGFVSTGGCPTSGEHFELLQQAGAI